MSCLQPHYFLNQIKFERVTQFKKHVQLNLNIAKKKYVWLRSGFVKKNIKITNLSTYQVQLILKQKYLKFNFF